MIGAIICGVLLLAGFLVIYSLCAAAGRADKQVEDMESRRYKR